MATRVMGMVSGLDTESLVKELVNAQKIRNKRVEDKKTTLGWKQDAWKTLNSKLYGFYTEHVSKIRLQSSYNNKKVSSSNETLVEVRAEGNAPLGAHSVTVKQLASSQYVTSGKIATDKDGQEITATIHTKMSALVDLSEIPDAKITIGDKTLEIDEDTTIANIIDLAREAGLNANFDQNQGRLFISSKESGLENRFQMFEENTGGVSILGALQLDSISFDDEGNIIESETNRSTIIHAQDSIVNYNGAELTGSSNVVTANGLTFTLKAENVNETVTLNVVNDSQTTYDMIKDFIKGYNEILKEMNELYYAESSRGYDPLTSEEKKEMSEDEIEKWETKIKDSLLRRDSTLGSVSSSLKMVMSAQVTVDGKAYSLSTYGIQTSPDYMEKGLLHIYGDSEDPTYADKEDKLLKAIEEDPDLVMEVFSQLGRNLHATMNERMEPISNIRSAFTFYNDKVMEKEMDNYEKQISELEKKLYLMEEKYYNQFARLEVALSKLQSQGDYLYNMLGQ
jgi:flagellar hook-associated protein 2